MMNKIAEQNKEWLDATWKKLDEKLSRVAIKSREKLPYTSIDGVHTDKLPNEPYYWTNGFWGGLMWIMYRNTGNEEYKKTALRSEELLDAAFTNYMDTHHDAGFMWHLTAGVNYRMTGDEKALNRNLYAAAVLASRYNPDGHFIQAWNNADENFHKANHWTIIDCLMNIPLLYWASEYTGSDRFKRMAMNHADMAIRDHVRPDGSVNHIVEHDLDTGEAIKVYAGQGYSETSCWTRGLSWAVYGTILSYVHTKKKEYLDAAIRTANYFIVNAKRTGYKTVVDFRAPCEPVYYDSTAGLCTACGLLELAKHVSEPEAEMYTAEAINILKATDENWCDYSENIDSVVMMGSERYPHNADAKIHLPIIYADYFFAEAIARLRGDDFLMW